MVRRSLVTAHAALDVLAVVAFAALGRRNHDESTAALGVLATAWPFLVALVAGWCIARAWRRPGGVGVGVVVWASTVAGGMLLRHAVAGRGTAAPFVVVASLFLGACIVLRRLVWHRMRRRFAPTASQ